MKPSALLPVWTCRRYRSVGAFRYAADFSQAASTLWVNFHDEDDAWQPLPYQVADARHDRREAERLIAYYFR